MTRIARHTATILVADDDETILRVTSTILTKSGYQVLTAHDGQNALQVFEDAQRAIQLLITDVAMPGMDGLELVRAIRSRSPSMPVLVMSASRGIACDPDIEAIMKPFTKEMIVAKVEELLAASDFAKVEDEQLSAKPQSFAAMAGAKSKNLKPPGLEAIDGADCPPELKPGQDCGPQPEKDSREE
jgi:CheY-like chemotaxis protein